MRLWVALFAGVAAFAAGAAHAQEKRADLRRELAGIFSGSGTPGAAVVLIENGETTVAEGFGFADVAAGTSATPDTVFRAGSIAKSVVGVIVMMLVEEEKLSLDDTLAVLAPEIPFDNPWEAAEPLRLAHLLEHTTGWADLSPREFALDDPEMSLLDGILVGGARESRFRPGQYHAYTSAGYGISGYVIEKIEGKPFPDVARERVFEPLGMASASYGETPDMARSYLPDGVEVPYSHYPLYPAGGLNLSAADLAKFSLFMIEGGKVRGRTLLTPESVARIERSETTLASLAGLADGYGLGNTAYVGEKAVFRGHGGAIDSFAANFRYNRQCRCGFAILANMDGIPRTAIAAIERRLADALPEPPPAEGREPSFKSFAGLYQPFAQRNLLTALIDSLTIFKRVDVSSTGVVTVNGDERAIDAEGRLRRKDRAAPSLIFANSDDGTLLLGATETYRRVSTRSLQLKAAFGVGFVLTFAASLLSFLKALFGWRLAGAHVAALAAFAPFAALFGLMIYAMDLPSPKSIALFGHETWLSYSVFAATLLLPVTGALATFAAILPGRSGAGSRLIALVTGGLVLVAAAYMASYGWIALRTWAI